jgi:hypothetical protein
MTAPDVRGHRIRTMCLRTFAFASGAWRTPTAFAPAPATDAHRAPICILLFPFDGAKVAYFLNFANFLYLCSFRT